MKIAIAMIGCLAPLIASAHQPVMDMAPRWDGGYGVQIRAEHFASSTTTWLEGVYTWDRSIRATLKLPVRGGELGDAILGLPLKKYRNDGASTSNWSVTPSVQVPTSSGGGWNTGLSVSFSKETPRFYQLYDLYTWEDRSGLDINVGLAFRDSGTFALWDVSVLQSTEVDRLQTGPVFVYFKKNFIFRMEYKALVRERYGSGPDRANSGDYVGIGVGWVY